MTARRWGARAVQAIAGLIVLSIVWAAIHIVVPPPLTPLMVIRRVVDGADMDRRWVPLEAISPNLVRAVIASEDARFCSHHGFDWEAINDAARENAEGGRLRGGSTISNQTAKNVFLWPGRSWIRKGAEAWFTLLIETLWSKRRIMEVYLNVIEWGDGTYGAESAAQSFFDRPAAKLSERQAALMAVVLPSPREWSPNRPGPWVSSRAEVIADRAETVRRQGWADCVLKGK